MIRILYKNIFVRLLSGLFAGAFTYFLIEIVFSIKYRYYSPFIEAPNYLNAIILGMITMEAIIQINRLIDKKLPWDRHPGRRWFIQSLSDIFVALFIAVILRLVLAQIMQAGRLIILADELLISLVIVLVVLAFNFTELGIFLNRKYRNSLAEAERFRKESAEYQFEMLKLQLNPHFLFNSLNTLSSLVHEDAEKASEFIRKLSDVYRYVLDNRSRELIALKEEMEFINSFTFLLLMRFQGMLNISIEIETAFLERQIAPMTIQLLVENAVKHNIASRSHPLNIRIFIENEYLWVLNDLQLKKNAENTGLGLKNIASRYAFLTDKKVEILNDDQYFKVKIPLI